MFGAYWNYCQISDGVLYYTSLRPTENEVHSMNKTFKIVFNKARGALMVANELTGSVQKKGTRIVLAAGLVALSACGTAFAQDFTHNQAEGNSGYSATTTDQTSKTWAAEDVLNLNVIGDTTQAYGLLASGKDHTYTNNGTINANENKTDNKAKFWKVKGMMADMGGTAINEGTINVENAYGMTVGSTKGDGSANTITNNGVINVIGVGVGMEAAPTGSSSTQGTAQAVATNNGTIKTSTSAGIGILISGDNGEVVNNGTIDASAGTAVLLHVESTDKTANGNSIIFGENSVTNGDLKVSNAPKNTKITFKKGSIFNGSIIVSSSASGTSLNADGLTFSNRTGDYGSAIFFGDAHGSVTLTNTVFTNNSVTGSDVYGGAVYSYGSPFKQVGGVYSGNTAVSTGADVNKNNKNQTGAGGGALMMKGNANSVLTDVVFTNNSAVAKKTESTTGGYAYGGALMIDYSTGAATSVANPTDIEIAVTKDLTYSGNTVSSNSTAKRFDTYGYHVDSAAAGGFLFLDRGSSANFNIHDGATLTIGSSVTDDDTDSIASSIPNTVADSSKRVNKGKHALITKTGTGTLLINSSLNKYFGTVSVDEGQMTVNSAWDIKNAVSISKGATLELPTFTLVSADKSGNQDTTGAAVGGSLSVSGTLKTHSSQVFKTGLSADGTNEASDGVKFTDLTFVEGSSLALTDAKYNLAYAKDAGNELKNAKLILLGELVGTNKVTLDDVADIGADTLLDQVTVSTENKNLQIGGSSSPDVGYRRDGLSVGALDLGTANQVDVSGNTLTLSGNSNGDQIIASENSVTLNLKDRGNLVLGGASAHGGTINGNVNIGQGSEVKVSGTETFTINSVTGAGNVIVGNDNLAGRLVIHSLTDMTGTIFVDPAWNNNVELNTVGQASHLSISNVDAALGANIVAGRNSLVALGASTDTAARAFEKIATTQGLAWGQDNITAAAYLGAPITLTDIGSILVNGSLVATPTEFTSGTLTVADKGMLIVDQNIASPVVTGKITFNGTSYLGVSNATVGTLTLATEGVGGSDAVSVVTDNPFIEGTVSAAGVLTNTMSAEGGLGALASTGIQAMTRRADTVLAQTIADRTSVDQELAAGTNLWVDVTGERYEADKLDNGGEFKSDMGYGAFGADFAVTQDITAGAAFQYGKGSLRSGVSSIKNSIDSYGVTAYGAMKFGDAKVVAEASYIKNENDITSSQTALNQSVDSEIYSVGVRGQHRFTAGNFQFVPSVGVRVSRLNTDAMQVGAVNIKKQEQTLVQVPIALRVNGFEQNVSGWSVAPSFKIAYVPTFGDKEISVFGADQTVIDTSPVQGDFGIRAQNGNLMVNANMMLGGGKDGTSSVGGKVGLKYVF